MQVLESECIILHSSRYEAWLYSWLDKSKVMMDEKRMTTAIRSLAFSKRARLVDLHDVMIVQFLHKTRSRDMRVGANRR